MSDDRIELYRSRLDSTTESSSHRPLQRIAFSSLYKVKDISSGQPQSTSVERTNDQDGQCNRTQGHGPVRHQLFLGCIGMEPGLWERRSSGPDAQGKLLAKPIITGPAVRARDLSIGVTGPKSA